MLHKFKIGTVVNYAQKAACLARHAARISPPRKNWMPALWARSGWPYGKIPTDVAVAATDPERGLLARQAILLPRCRLWYRQWPKLPAIKSRAGAL